MRVANQCYQSAFAINVTDAISIVVISIEINAIGYQLHQRLDCTQRIFQRNKCQSYGGKTQLLS